MVRLSILLNVERRQKRVRAKRRSSSSSSSSSSPSPPRAEDLKKSVCFWGYGDLRKTEWYVFDVSDIKKSAFIMGKDKYEEKGLNKIKKTHRLPEGISFLPRHLHREENRGELIPFSVMPDESTLCGTCVAIGSVIYHFGGDYDHLDRVICFDLNTCGGGGGGWRNCPPMRNKRAGTRALALDGKLYVMGGGETEQSGPWAEVYDPCLEIWESLPPPPSESPLSPTFVAVVEASKKILVIFHASSLLHAYDLTMNSWVIIDCLPDYSCYGLAAVVDHTAYYIGGPMIRALDLERNTWFTGMIKGLEEDFVIQHNRSAGVYPTLLHLSGDKFCVFYVDRLGTPTSTHCVKIRISKCNGHDLNAYVESCQSYIIDHKFTFRGAILLDGRFILGKKASR